MKRDSIAGGEGCSAARKDSRGDKHRGGGRRATNTPPNRQTSYERQESERTTHEEPARAAEKAIAPTAVLLCSLVCVELLFSP